MAMSEEKLKEILDLYWKTTQKVKDEKRYSWAEWDGLELHVATKVREMIPTCRELLAAGRREKLMRWLGFMQGALWAAGIFSVDELKKHNMPPDEEFKGVAH